MSIIKRYFQRKSKLGIGIDIAVGILIVLVLIPGTRKEILPIILRQTLFIHQPSPVHTPVQLTDRAKQWKLKDASGVVHKIEDFKGKPVFINLWATWCPPCIAEMPELQKLYSAYGDKVQFLFISHEKQNVVSTFLTQKGYNLPTFVALDHYPAQLSSQSIPSTFILNKKGELVLAKKGVAKWYGNKSKILLEALINE
jgi:thiol-disulfide isomerase/thioredoxin